MKYTYWRLEHVRNVMAHAQKPDLVFQRKGRVHLNWEGGESVHSTTGSRGVRISSSNGSNAGYTMFWGRVQDYWLPTPLACFPFTSPPVRHRVPSGTERAIRVVIGCPFRNQLFYWLRYPYEPSHSARWTHMPSINKDLNEAWKVDTTPTHTSL